MIEAAQIKKNKAARLIPAVVNLVVEDMVRDYCQLSRGTDLILLSVSQVSRCPW